MFLRSKKHRKDGKTHRYFSVVENRRVRSGRVVQRQVLFCLPSSARNTDMKTKTDPHIDDSPIVRFNLHCSRVRLKVRVELTYRFHLYMTDFPWYWGFQGSSSIQLMSILLCLRWLKSSISFFCCSTVISPIPMSSPAAPLEMGTGTLKVSTA